MRSIELALLFDHLERPIMVTGQLADTPTRGLPSRGPDNSRTGHLADWSTRGLHNSRTGQVADWTTRGCHRRLCVLSFPFWRHARPRVVQYATCPVRELTSARSSCLVHEMSSPRVGNPRVGVSASCPVTPIITPNHITILANVNSRSRSLCCRPFVCLSFVCL